MSVTMQKGGATPVDPPPPVGPAPRSATLRRRSRSAVARSTGGDRWLLVLVGLVLLAAGTVAALVSYGVLGAGRASRPLLDPVVVDTLRAFPLAARIVAVVVGALLLVLGLLWAARSLRPERRPDLHLDGGPETPIVVSASAAADALADQAHALDGVGRAKARMVGSETAPALRLSLWVADDADVRDVLARLESDVLEPARRSLGLAALPVAVRLELDQPTSGPRVA